VRLELPAQIDPLGAVLLIRRTKHHDLRRQVRLALLSLFTVCVRPAKEPLLGATAPLVDGLVFPDDGYRPFRCARARHAKDGFVLTLTNEGVRFFVRVDGAHALHVLEAQNDAHPLGTTSVDER